MSKSSRYPKSTAQLSNYDPILTGAIRSILNHYWVDERDDFLATTPELRTHHIFTHFQVLALCLGSSGDEELSLLRKDHIL